MDLFYFQSKDKNFGDELNARLLPALMPGAFGPASPPGTLVGIGTILDNRLPEAAGAKIVFGSGVRGLSRPEVLDKGWDIRFVRGPISGAITGAPFIADPAYAVRLLPEYARASAGTGPVGLMPHFGSLSAAPWQDIAQRCGLTYIDPTGDVDVVLGQIAECRGIVAEAMHGAILADALRVPWMRLAAAAWRREGIHVHGLKWIDWAMSLGVDPRVAIFAELPPATGGVQAKLLRAPFRTKEIGKMQDALTRLAPDQFQLSDDGRLASVLEQLADQARRITEWARS
ncbi:MAG: polysaccharide pyruvyl transferase family protein [Phycisphaerales bacterium JB060]